MSQKAWHERPAEEAALFNPPFVATVLHSIAGAFHQESGRALPFVLAFVAAPTVLASAIRDSLPQRKDSSLAAWLQAHPRTRMQFPAIASAMVPAIREGVLFGLSKQALAIDGTGIQAQPLKKGAAAVLATTTRDVETILLKARFVGRWYAHAGTEETVMVLWGVRP